MFLVLNSSAKQFNAVVVVGLVYESQLYPEIPGGHASFDVIFPVMKKKIHYCLYLMNFWSKIFLEQGPIMKQLFEILFLSIFFTANLIISI